MAVSASRQISAIMATASRGYLPLAVSPLSITQSEPSSTAFATSETSARVGRGLTVIDSSICVAQITGLAAMLHLEIIIFCARNTFCAAISMPRSPRATMMPSDSSRISSKFLTPSWFSILEMILMCLPFSPSTARTSRTSEALRMKDAKTMSTFCSTPNRRSLLSFSDTAGRSTLTLGRLTPLWLPSIPELTTFVLTKFSPSSVTSREMRPSSM
mmetsp:Transcript_15742/g.61482  ORF Transcript_15742/g.61482 Transcript_15742/m.61482 type:complete len:215 (-) Transcript_15742:524-1168(-)